jgi:sortase (surface protein transpeptidase)
VHAWGLRYIYEIQTVEYVRPDDPDVFQSEDLSWVTLVTCSSYDETLDEYRLRVAVRAVLVAIENEPADVESSRLRVGTESHTVQMASKTLIA